MTNTQNWANKEFVLEQVKKDGLALKYGSKELKNDIDVVLEAVKQNGYALYHASKELQNDIFSAISLLQLKI
jgi:hypothetical protein